MTLTPRQLSTTIAALRYWQARNQPAKPDIATLEATARVSGPSLDEEEIEELAEFLMQVRAGVKQ